MKAENAGQREDLSGDLVQETPPLISQELSSLGSLRIALSAARGVRTSSFRLAYFTCFYDQSNLREKAIALAHRVRVRSMDRGMSRKLEPEAAGYKVSVIPQQRVRMVCLISPSLCSVQDGSTQNGASQIGSSQLMSR